MSEDPSNNPYGSESHGGLLTIGVCAGRTGTARRPPDKSASGHFRSCAVPINPGGLVDVYLANQPLSADRKRARGLC